MGKEPEKPEQPVEQEPTAEEPSQDEQAAPVEK